MLPFVWINKLQICIFMFRYQWNLQHADYADSDRYFYLNLEMHDHNTRCSKCSTCKARTNIKQFSVLVRGPTLHNFLPTELTTACHFQTQLKQHFMESLYV